MNDTTITPVNARAFASKMTATLKKRGFAVRQTDVLTAMALAMGYRSTNALESAAKELKAAEAEHQDVLVPEDYVTRFILLSWDESYAYLPDVEELNAGSIYGAQEEEIEDDALLERILTEGVVTEALQPFPRAEKYDVPDNATESGMRRYLTETFGLRYTDDMDVHAFDTGDDGAYGTYLAIALPPELAALLDEKAAHPKPEDMDAIAEWVGLHYLVNFDTETREEKEEWIQRYRASMAG